MRILLIDHRPERSALLRRCLQEAGYEIVASIGSGADIAVEIDRHRPDLIVVDMDSPARDLLEDLHRINQANPRPIAMFVAQDEPTALAQAVEKGVSLYTVDGMSPVLAKSVLRLATAQFERFRKLEAELEQSRTALAERRRIEKAKGLLMAERGLTEEQAYKAMRKMAMDRNMRLVDVADTILALEQVLKR